MSNYVILLLVIFLMSVGFVVLLSYIESRIKIERTYRVCSIILGWMWMLLCIIMSKILNV